MRSFASCRRPNVVLAAVALALATLLVVTLVPQPAEAAVTDDVRADADWILSAQLSDGAIANYVDRQAIWPYLANFAAMGLVRAKAVTGDSRYIDAAWRWLRWYQAHQDGQGFVTDYRVVNGAMVSTGDMDSTDSYAGTFLMAVRDAHGVSRNLKKLRSVADGVKAAVRAIEATQDADGLTWAKPAWKVKYLMDQAETYAGLVAAEQIGRALGDTGLADRAATRARRMKAGVAQLWNPTTGAYDWAVHEDGTRFSNRWSVLYPDSLQQVWAVAYGLVDAPRAESLAGYFHSMQPSWDQPAATALFDGGTQPVGYWPVAGLALAAVGNPDGVGGAATIRSAAVASGRQWPFTTGNAGQLILLESFGKRTKRR